MKTFDKFFKNKIVANSLKSKFLQFTKSKFLHTFIIQHFKIFAIYKIKIFAYFYNSTFLRENIGRHFVVLGGCYTKNEENLSCRKFNVL